MQISWHGTASLAIWDGMTKILVDPYLRPNKRLPAVTLKDFEGADAVIITHGHIDHLMDVPQVMAAYKNLQVYCTAAPSATLERFGVEKERIHTIAPGDVFSVGGFTMRAMQARHVKFNFGYVLMAIPRIAVMLPKGIAYGLKARHYPEKKENLMYEVRNGEKTILLAGSFGTVPGESYTDRPDLFVFPYNGSTSVLGRGIDFMKEIRPGAVMVNHHDNSFPPMTMAMNTKKLADEVEKALPGTPVTVPVLREGYEV